MAIQLHWFPWSPHYENRKPSATTSIDNFVKDGDGLADLEVLLGRSTYKARDEDMHTPYTTVVPAKLQDRRLPPAIFYEIFYCGFIRTNNKCCNSVVVGAILKKHGNGACPHYVMASKFQWKPFWLATQLYSQKSQKSKVRRFRVNYDVFAKGAHLTDAISESAKRPHFLEKWRQHHRLAQSTSTTASDHFLQSFD